jgi:hypothetical protein
MTSPGSMSPIGPQQREDLQRDVAATLEARRELGPSYDDHFVQSLTERMMAQVRHEMARTPAPAASRVSNRLDRSQRTAVAICSLIFAVPLIAIASGELGLTGMIVVAGMIALINFFASL